ncbi:MAG: DUF2089 domain-containing protein [Lentisphaerae bacterium]|nr:DUF2089 domain-containing protein [Lentisphaerota bacterium]
MKCNSCGGPLEISEVTCPACDLTIRGTVSLPRLARLTPEDCQFIELFVLAGGSLKEVGKHLNLSYPTVRNRLDKVIANLQQLDADKRTERARIIESLERGELSTKEALDQLNKL